jgi:hypothetical protein
VSYFVPMGVNSTTTAIPALIACSTAGMTAVPSLACTTKTL